MLDPESLGSEFLNICHSFAYKYLETILKRKSNILNMPKYFRRFVEDALDDYEGKLTRNGVSNFHGIVKFEVAKVYTQDTGEPQIGWDTVDPLAETYSFREKLSDGIINYV